MIKLNQRLMDEVLGLRPTKKEICECGHRKGIHHQRIGHCMYWLDAEKQCDCPEYREVAALDREEQR